MIGIGKMKNLTPIFKDGNLVGKRRHTTQTLGNMSLYRTECETNRSKEN